jgi:hypothetical protein
MNMYRIIRSTFVNLIVLVPAIFPVFAQIFVSPQGSDGNPGTLDAPFATLQKAMDAVTGMNINMKQDINIYLRGGTYRIDNTVNIDDRHSGKNGHNVIIQNYPEEIPVISGGRNIDGWEIHDKSKNIYKASALSMNFRQLYINGKWGIRSRHPNVENGVFPYGCYADNGPRVTYVPASELASWKNQSDVDIHGKGGGQWNDVYYRVNKVFSDHVILAPEQDVLYTPDQSNGPTACHAGWVVFENAYEIIDSEGEWYVDTHKDTVYYKPRSSEDMATAEFIAPALENIVRIEGTSLDNMAHNIVFYGIHFMHSTWMRPSSGHGFLNVQAGQCLIADDADPRTSTPASGFLIEKANSIKIERCVFSNMGSTAIGAEFSNYDITIIGNVISDVAGAGVLIGPKGPIFGYTRPGLLWSPGDPRERCINALVSNNFITRSGQMYYTTVPVSAGYVTNATIEHNEICETLYSGISMGWGWASMPNCMENNQVRYNDIHNVLQKFQDGGGIYTLSAQPNSRIYENYIHDIILTGDRYDYLTGGIYLDAGSGGIAVENNVFKNAGAAGDQNTGNTAVIDNSGLEAQYADIVNLNPAPSLGPISIRNNKRLSIRSETRECKVLLYNIKGQRLATFVTTRDISVPEFCRQNKLSSGTYLLKTAGDALNNPLKIPIAR